MCPQDNEPYKLPGTIEDASVIEGVAAAIAGLGERKHLFPNNRQSCCPTQLCTHEVEERLEVTEVASCAHTAPAHCTFVRHICTNMRTGSQAPMLYMVQYNPYPFFPQERGACRNDMTIMMCLRAGFGEARAA